MVAFYKFMFFTLFCHIGSKANYINIEVGSQFRSENTMLTDSSVQRCQSLFLVEVVSRLSSNWHKNQETFPENLLFSLFDEHQSIQQQMCDDIWVQSCSLCKKTLYHTYMYCFVMQLGTRFQFIPHKLKLNQIPSPKSCHIKTFAILHFARTFAVTTTIKALYMTLSCNISLEFHFNLSFSR